MGCVVNVAIGDESRLSEELIVKTTDPQKIVVVGGGPSGLEAARLAALAGHDVILFEADRRLGGAVNIARRAPKLAGIADIIHWMEQEVYRLNVDVRLSTFAEADDILAERPAKIIIATGSLPRMDGAQASGYQATGVEQPHVFSSHKIFDVPIDRLGMTALVFDDVGHYEGIAVAEYLIEKGIAVNFVSRHAAMAPLLATTGRAYSALTRLNAGDFTARTDGRLREIMTNGVVITIGDSDKPHFIPADSVVLITANLPNSDLAAELAERLSRDSGITVKLVGDALSPREMAAAIYEGHMAGRFAEEFV